MAYSNVQNTTDTLGIGSRAPDFRLTAVNTNQTHSLAELVADSPVILEFMRGLLLSTGRASTKQQFNLKIHFTLIVLEYSTQEYSWPMVGMKWSITQR